MSAATESIENTISPIRPVRARTDMVSQKPFDYTHAHKWAPDADCNDLESMFPQHEGVLSQEKLWELYEKELAEWMAKLPKSKEKNELGSQSMPFGVFGTYQKDWLTPILPYAERSMGNKLWDVDGNEYIDFNFGDTPDMYGHGPNNPAVAAVAKRLLEDGMSSMMCNEDAIITSQLLTEKFGVTHWMHCMTATDANRYVIAQARHVTGRPNVAIPNMVYHGTLEETQKYMPEPGVISRFHELDIYAAPVEHGTKIFHWNDLESLEEILADRSVAVLIMEPVLSNFGWAWPIDGWHDGVRELCDKYGTLLCYDETHTLGTGPAGMVGKLGLKGDFWTCGKAISSGIPGAVFGMTEAIARKVTEDHNATGHLSGAGMGFLGNSLSGNTMSTLALRITLEEVFTDEVFAKIYDNAEYMKKGMEAIIEKYNAPFRVETMGNRLCYHFIPDKCHDPIAGLVQIGFGGFFELSHAYLWNRGMLIMPYFNMLLLAPEHSHQDTDKFLRIWDEFVCITMGG